MTTRDAETLAQLVSDQAGRGRKFTFEQLADRSVDPESGYKPSPNLVWSIASGKSVKLNPPLVRALAAGLGLPPARVADAAHRQFLGWYATDPASDTRDSSDDAIYRVATKEGVTPEQMPAVEAFFEQLRREREGGE
ncbi:hypothetical protein RM863_12610 [Streptomyces sp. DSM 41014]|uniref:XRE family transcriptional regulator n=1 Tax=Streptomyces hintoniae TaxID=3075521 RepID=A0ABU2UIH8_9ACTN|nr:hypothetical protein [Streptomyces sp. DSM 41014]MDT0472965.1 hypothetical protein [Streptomyces sp. DSM 41014]